ncbi:unnamed protein product [Lampetra fluviatilis]
MGIRLEKASMVGKSGGGKATEVLWGGFASSAPTMESEWLDGARRQHSFRNLRFPRHGNVTGPGDASTAHANVGPCFRGVEEREGWTGRDEGGRMRQKEGRETGTCDGHGGTAFPSHANS